MRDVYTRAARLTEVHDGDTITVDTDLGMNVWVKGVHIRLLDVWAKELKEDGGEQARDALIAMLKGKDITIQTIRRSSGTYVKSFNRWLGVVWADGVNVNEWMVLHNHATRERPTL